MNTTDVKDQFLALLKSSLSELGKKLTKSTSAVATYAAKRADHLADLVDEPGFQEAVIAERDAVLVFAGIQATEAADAADARLIGVIHGALALAATALAAA